MAALHYLPTWLLFAAIAIPLTSVALSSRRISRELARNADHEPKTVLEGPLIDNGDGTSTQNITVSAITSISGYHTQNFGPISISANAREWAANAVLLGLFLVLVGLIGLLHFPTQSVVHDSQQNVSSDPNQGGG